MTDSGGEDDLSATYTAFGERIDGTNHRYGYAGAYGYQAHDDLPFLHVGHRYYDPATGRFLQRDPIGVIGGLNTYEYVRSMPANLADPIGLHDGGGWHWKRLPPDCPKPPKGKTPIDPLGPDDPKVYPYDEMKRDRNAHIANAVGAGALLGLVAIYLPEIWAACIWAVDVGASAYGAAPVD
jgi:RHS repeat-associated protein